MLRLSRCLVEKPRVLNGKDGVRRLYDDLAVIYDTSRYLCITRMLERCEEKFINRELGNFNSPVLDVGCGTGRYSLRLAGRGVEVISIDLSRKMLQVLRHKIRISKLDGNVNMILADGENLPLRENVLRALICTLTFDHLKDSEIVAKEFSRVLKQGGLCIVSTLNRRMLNLLKKLLRIPPEKIIFFAENIPPTLVYEVGHSAEELRELFGRYGLKTVTVRGYCHWGFAEIIPIFGIESLLTTSRKLLRYALLHVVKAVKVDQPRSFKVEDNLSLLKRRKKNSG